MLWPWHRSKTSSLRYRLLGLVLYPILMIAPLTVGFVVHWSHGFSQDQLLRRVRTDLAVAHDSFARLQQRYLQLLEQLAGSHAFYTHFASDNAVRVRQQLATVRETTGFHYIELTDLSGRRLFSETQLPSLPLSPQHSAVRYGETVGIEVLEGDVLQQIDPRLNPRSNPVPYSNALVGQYPPPLHLDLSPDSSPDPPRQPLKERALLVRVLAPVRDPQGTVVALLDGGVVLNKDYELVDGIRDLVYGPSSLPEGSYGTVGMFLDDVSISTNNVTPSGRRAVGARASAEVKAQVLGRGKIWVDYALLGNDWFISAYEPIVDVYGTRIGMLYTGFLESPFRHAYYRSLALALLLLVIGIFFAALVAVRGVHAIFGPIERMARAVRAIQAGEDKRVGEFSVDDEIAELAREFDKTLDLLRLRNDEVKLAAERLETQVEARTHELKEKNQRLEETIEQLHTMQRQLVATERLAALGELTAGVAHEINNPLAVIQGNLEVMRQELAGDAGRVDIEMGLILEQVERMKAIVSQLLRYSRPAAHRQPVEANLRALLADTVLLVQHAAEARHISIGVKHLSERRPAVDATELQQVLVNLLINAIHASRKGAVVDMTVCDEADDLVISVRDRGTGIAPEYMDRIFDPFFSTKKVGGTGLGLSVSYGLMKGMGGRIVVASTPGKGSEFKVMLPIVVRAQATTQ